MWRQHTRPVQLRQGEQYVSMTPCCDVEVAIRVTRLLHGQATSKRCDGCEKLWHVRVAVDEGGAHFAYWRRLERQPSPA